MGADVVAQAQMHAHGLDTPGRLPGLRKGLPLTHAWLMDYVIPGLIDGIPLVGVSLFGIWWQGRKTRSHVAQLLAPKGDQGGR